MSFARNHIVSAVAVAVTAISVACGSAEVSPLDPATLADTEWVGTEIVIDGETFDVVVQSPPTVQFDGTSTIGGTTGCNSYGGTVELGDDATLQIPDGLAVTEMACVDPPGLMEQEERMLEVLNGADRWTIEEGVLTIHASENSSSVELVPAEPAQEASLEESVWRLESITIGDTERSPVRGLDTEVFLSFSTNDGMGTLEGNTGCNSFTADVTVGEASLVVGTVTSTLIGCSSEIADQDTVVLDVIDNARTWRIEDGILTIQDDAGRGLSYQAS